MSTRLPIVAVAVLIALTVTACGSEAAGPDEPAPRAPTGTILFAVSTGGSELDADGYAIQIMQLARTERVGTNDSLRITGLELGSYTVLLQGVAANCLSEPAALRSALVRAEAETRVAWDVTCYVDRWRQQTIASSRNLRIAFVDTNHGFASGRGDRPEFWVTSDGGTTWTKRSDAPAPGDVGSLFYMRDAQLGFIGGANMQLARTEDGGATWSVQRLAESGGYLLRAYFLGDYGWLGGSRGWFFRTRDAGKTWQQVTLEFNRNTFGVFFADTLNGVIATEGGGVYTSADGGQTWTQRSSGTGQHLQEMDFMNDSVGVAVGDNGVIIRTTNRGVTWSAATTPSSIQLWGVDISPDGFGVAAGEEGTLLVTRDGGLTWEKEFTAAQTVLVHPSVVSQNFAWVGGRATILRRVVP